jgi:plastocyanin
VRRLLTIAIFSAVTVALLAAACGSDPDPTPVPQQSPPPPPPAAQPTTPAETPASTANVPTGCSEGDISFKIENQDIGGSGSYVFAPSDLTFNVGDTICFTVNAETEFHTFTVDALSIDVSLDPGTTETFNHTFGEAGEFELICIPHQALGMVGTITVQ